MRSFTWPRRSNTSSCSAFPQFGAREVRAKDSQMGHDCEMKVRVLEAEGDTPATLVADLDGVSPNARWVWVDIEAGEGDTDELISYTSNLPLDSLAIRDAVDDFDLPKIDDFGSSMLVVLHGLIADRIATYGVHCFLTAKYVVTVRLTGSLSLDLLWSEVQRRPELASGGSDELLARLADIMTRRLLSILDVFDNRVEELIAQALVADPELIAEVTAVRADLAILRHVIVPQREALDSLRNSTSPLLSGRGRRRVSDVFDVASRATHGVAAARTALAETLDAYRGAEARRATEVSKVLTIYAAIMLPLSLIAGFFGMNFENLPLVHNPNGWLYVTAIMAGIGLVSLGIFVALGWVKRPTGRGVGITLGHGLVEAARAPAQVVGAVLEISTMPLRSVVSTRKKRPAETD